MPDVPLSKQRATSDTISSLNKVDDWRMTEPAATAAPAKKKPKNGGKKRGNQNAQSRQTPASGKMPGFERFVESRLGKAGGTYKTLGTGGEVFRRGEFKGMTVEQALEKLRPEYSGLSGSEKSDWESQGAMNDVRSPGEGGRPFSEPPGPAGYNDRPTFSSNGPDTKFKMRSAAEVDSRNAQNRYEAGRNAVAAKKAEQASRTANLAYGATLSQNGNQRTLTDRNGKLIGYSGNAPSVPTAPKPVIAPPAPTVGNLNTSAGSFAPTVPLPVIGGATPNIKTPGINQNAPTAAAPTVHTGVPKPAEPPPAATTEQAKPNDFSKKVQDFEALLKKQKAQAKKQKAQANPQLPVSNSEQPVPKSIADIAPGVKHWQKPLETKASMSKSESDRIGRSLDISSKIDKNISEHPALLTMFGALSHSGNTDGIINTVAGIGEPFRENRKLYDEKLKVNAEGSSPGSSTGRDEGPAPVESGNYRGKRSGVKTSEKKQPAIAPPPAATAEQAKPNDFSKKVQDFEALLKKQKAQANPQSTAGEPVIAPPSRKRVASR